MNSVLSDKERVNVAEEIFSRLCPVPDGINGSLMCGNAGILIFAAAVMRFVKDEKIKKQAETLFDELMGKMELYVDNAENASFSDGAAGWLFALRRVKEITGDSRADKLTERVIDYLRKCDYAGLTADYVNGKAGVLKVICSNDDVFSSQGIAALAGSLADSVMTSLSFRGNNEIVWKSPYFGKVLSGIGHGQCGIASALFAAGKRLGRQDCIFVALALYEFELSVYSSEAKAWPDYRPLSADNIFRMHGYCCGAPGIGFDMLSKSGEPFGEMLADAIDACLEHELLKKDHLCCGNCSAVDFLLEAGSVLKREDLTEAALRRLTDMYRRKNGDFACVDDNSCGDGMSLYYGLAGIGYEYLRSVYQRQLKSCLL